MTVPHHVGTGHHGSRSCSSSRIDQDVVHASRSVTWRTDSSTCAGSRTSQTSRKLQAARGRDRGGRVLHMLTVCGWSAATPARRGAAPAIDTPSPVPPPVTMADLQPSERRYQPEYRHGPAARSRRHEASSASPSAWPRPGPQMLARPQAATTQAQFAGQCQGQPRSGGAGRVAVATAPPLTFVSSRSRSSRAWSPSASARGDERRAGEGLVDLYPVELVGGPAQRLQRALQCRGRGHRISRGAAGNLPADRVRASGSSSRSRANQADATTKHAPVSRPGAFQRDDGRAEDQPAPASFSSEGVSRRRILVSLQLGLVVLVEDDLVGGETPESSARR